MDWVSFLWHRILSPCLVTGADTHTLDMLRSHWKIPSDRSLHSTKSSHTDPRAVSRHVRCSRPAQVSVCSTKTQIILHWNGGFCWSWNLSTSSLLICQLSPPCLCLMQWKSEIPTCSKVNTETCWGHSVQEPLLCGFYRNFESVIQWSMFAFFFTKKTPVFAFDTGQSAHITKTMLSQSNSDIFLN